MRHMGGLASKLKITTALMWIGSLALAGVPIFAGFYSKDAILESAFAAHTGAGQYAFWLGIAAAVMTAFYSWRLLFMTFHGHPHDHHHFEQAHESPRVMIWPLYVLAAGALFAGIGFAGMFLGEPLDKFWGKSILILPEHSALHESHHVPLWVKLLPIACGIVGIFVAWQMYIRNTAAPAALAAQHRPLYLFLLNKWYFDELYEVLFVRPAKWLGTFLWKKGDGATIDGLGPDGVSKLTLILSGRATKLQTGYVYHYAFAMLIGVALLVTWYFWALAH